MCNIAKIDYSTRNSGGSWFLKTNGICVIYYDGVLNQSFSEQEWKERFKDLK